MNQLQTCKTERLAEVARCDFSSSEGYALYRCSKSHMRRIFTDSLGKLPRRFLAAAETPDSSRVKLLAWLALFSGSNAFIVTCWCEGQWVSLFLLYYHWQCELAVVVVVVVVAAARAAVVELSSFLQQQQQQQQ